MSKRLGDLSRSMVRARVVVLSGSFFCKHFFIKRSLFQEIVLRRMIWCLSTILVDALLTLGTRSGTGEVFKASGRHRHHWLQQIGKSRLFFRAGKQAIEVGGRLGLARQTLPCRYWLGEKLRTLDQDLLQPLLHATVTALKEEISGLGENVSIAHTRKVSFPLHLSRGLVGSRLRSPFARGSFPSAIIAHFLVPFKGCFGLVGLQKPCDRLSSGGPQPSLSRLGMLLPSSIEIHRYPKLRYLWTSHI
jgi:hypothetical protein